MEELPTMDMLGWNEMDSLQAKNGKFEPDHFEARLKSRQEWAHTKKDLKL